ncbi:MAG: hypothetical protein K6G30_12615, partial [Acetatifactor sp.]|nr:hypothetical protein [Acetatifactor sp.]
NGTGKCYTVLDICTAEKLYLSKNDELYVGVNDYIRPLSEESRGELLFKNSKADNWSYGRDIDLLWVGLQDFSAYSEQLGNHHNFSRIIVSIKSDLNPETSCEKPIYTIRFTHYETSRMLLYFAIVAIVIILVTTMWIKRQHR